MSSMRLDFDFSAFADDVADEVGSILAIAIAEAAPVASVNGGALRDSISYRVVHVLDGIGVEIVSQSPYAGFVLHGTQAHLILPRNAKVLAWQGGDGAMHFAKAVHHPGTQPNDFVERAVSPIRGALAVAIKTALMGSVKVTQT